MEWLMTLILGLVVILILYWKAVSSVNYWKNRGIPYLKPIPIFGNSLDVILLRRTFVEQFRNQYRQFSGERFVGLMQFMKPVLMIRDPEVISQVLIKEFSHFHDRGFPMDEKLEPLSASLVNLTGEKWRQVRHRLTPTFTSGKLKTMFSQIVECADDAINFLKDKKEAVEVRQYMQKFNLNVIGLVAFGLKVDAFNDKSERSNTFVKQSTKFFAPSTKTLINFLFRMSFPKLGGFLKIRFMDPKVSDFFFNLVNDTVKYRETTNTRRNDFIQLMLDLKTQEQSKLLNKSNLHNGSQHQPNKDEHNKDELEDEDHELLEQLKNVPLQSESHTPVFDDNCIAAQSFLFISGGSETTATVLSFAMYELAVNQDVQKKLQKEIDTVLGTQEFDYRAVKDLVYLEQVLNEVMRLHPPGGILARVCTEEFILPGTDVLIEKGVVINIPVLGLHTNPQYFPDPEKFDPDRFSDMNNIPRGVFMPFGGGPRICIAMRLAMLEMKIYLAKLLSKYHLTLSDKTQRPLKMATNALVLIAVGGVWVHFEEREQASVK